MKDLSFAEACWVVLIALAVFFGGMVLAALVFKLFIWNLGVVYLGAACGATISKISFSTAIGGVFILGALRGIFSPPYRRKQVTE